MIVLLLKTFAVSFLWLQLYCCCCVSVQHDSALLVPQSISTYDEPCVAVSFVAGRHCAGKSVARVQSAQFLGMMKYSDRFWFCRKISQFLLDIHATVCLALLYAKCSFVWVSPLEEKSFITLWMRGGGGRAGTCHRAYWPHSPSVSLCTCLYKQRFWIGPALSGTEHASHWKHCAYFFTAGNLETIQNLKNALK